MPRVAWPLRHGRPTIEVVLTQLANRQPLHRCVLADTGAGTIQSRYEFLLEESDCLLCGGQALFATALRGAYAGSFTVYRLRVQIPTLGFDQPVRVVAVPVGLPGFDGLACFRFINRFGYGNFGNPTQFGLETP
jgi:hypothetical protein